MSHSMSSLSMFPKLKKKSTLAREKTEREQFERHQSEMKLS